MGDDFARAEVSLKCRRSEDGRVRDWYWAAIDKAVGRARRAAIGRPADFCSGGGTGQCDAERRAEKTTLDTELRISRKAENARIVRCAGRRLGEISARIICGGNTVQLCYQQKVG